MAEIKSTLDLVMEKTRHLSLSPEEKEENERRAFSLRLQGVLQKIEDGLLDMTAATEEIDGLLEKEGRNRGHIVCRQLAERMAVEKHNGPWIELLTRFCRADGDELRKAALENARKLASAEEKRKRQLLDELALHGIRGSAIEPNLDADHILAEKQQALTQNFKRLLEDLIGLP